MADFQKGCIPWNKGIPQKPEVKLKISLAKLGRPSGRKGIKYSDELKKKLSLAHLGHKPSAKTLEKMSVAQRARGPRAYITPEWKEKMRLSRIGKMQKGENRYNWISDRSQLKDDSKDRGGQRHRDWSRRVKNRDHWKCRINNQDCLGRMESHHILGWSEYPELRYDINNGITLCHKHHPHKRVEEKQLAPIFQELMKVS